MRSRKTSTNPDEILVVLSRYARTLLGSQLDLLLGDIRREFSLRMADQPGPTGLKEELDRHDECFRCLLIVGGDGTINLVLNSLPDLLMPVAIFPAGTANDLATYLQLSPDCTSVLPVIMDGHEVLLDKIQVNDRIFCTTGGLGLPGDSAMRISRFRERGALRIRLVHWLGAAAYWLAASRDILMGRGTSREILIEHRLPGSDKQATRRVDSPGILIANQPILAGRLPLSPLSRPDDGVFEIVILRQWKRRRLISLLLKLARGGSPSKDEVEILTTDRAVIRCSEVEQFFGDGEFLCHGTEFELKLSPTPLRVLGPKSLSKSDPSFRPG